MGRHARVGELTEPMAAVKAVRPTAPPIDPAPKTATMPAISAAEVAEWDLRRAAMLDADEWLDPLRTGGTRTEHRMRATFKERGLILAKRVSRKALRLRAALAKGGRA